MYTVLDTDEKAARFRKKLERERIPMIAMDFEGEFNLHRYGERLCLIQIYDGSHFYIADPFGISREELAGLFESKVTKLFYDASSDRMLVYKQYGIKIRAILDLKVLVDTLGFEQKSLSAVLNTLFRIEAPNKKKFQRYNWLNRPIDESALRYALSDVEFLFRLKDELIRRIEKEERTEELLCALSAVHVDYDKKSVPGIKKKKSYLSMRPGEKKIFDQIYEAREKIAKKIDRPPNFVLSNDQLFRLAFRDITGKQMSFNGRISPSIRTEFETKIQRILSSVKEQ